MIKDLCQILTPIIDETKITMSQAFTCLNRALAALAVLAGQNKMLTLDMLKSALNLRFTKAAAETALAVVEKAVD